MKADAAALTAALAFALSASAEPAGSIQSPRDIPYPGEIQLRVDATDVARGIFNVHETVPLAGPGPVTLLYPEWLPGNHAPRGPIDKLAGLRITTPDGTLLPWRRDPVNVFAFRVDAPAGARALEIRFQFVSPTQRDQGRIVTTPVMLNLQWNAVVLYPAGHYARQIRVTPQLTTPAGWTVATALDGARADGATTRFATTDLDTLVDSPVFAGQHAQRIDLTPPGAAPVRLTMVADRPYQLAATPAQIAPHRALIREALALFGPGRFDHYEMLLALSDSLGGIGLEHLRSSENNRGANYFTEWDATAPGRDLLAHELTHSWNGKFRRPADLATPNFDVPMQTSLLWVYEGQTQYWGQVLAARSGLWTKENALQSLALTAATYDNRVGRAWRALADTVNEPSISQRRPEPWRSWQRPEDYYSEGQLIWLDADTLIREKTGGAKSLDDFARVFFASEAPGLTTKTYTFEDVVAALNAVAPHDWAKFLRDRLDTTGGKAPLDGMTRGGYRLVYTETRSDFLKADEKRGKYASFYYSLGFNVGEADRITDVLWDGPAFDAGLTIGTEIRAVNGFKYDAEGLRRALTDAKSGAPLELLVQSGDRFRTIRFDYRGGQRYPALERIPDTPDRLGDILRARTPTP